MVRNTCRKHCKQPETDIFARGGRGVTTAAKGLRNIETVKQKQKAFKGGVERGGGREGAYTYLFSLYEAVQKVRGRYTGGIGQQGQHSIIF